MQKQNDIDSYPDSFDGFEDVYLANYDAVLKYCLRRTSNVQIAEDITSATFIKVLSNFKKYDDRGMPIIAWIYRIAANELASYYRKRDNKYRPSLDDDSLRYSPLVVDDILDEIILNQDILERDQLFQKTIALINTMPSKYKEVLLLHYAEHLKISDIAIVLDCKVGTIKSLLSRGRQHIRSQMQPNSENCVKPNATGELQPRRLNRKRYSENL